MLERKKLTRQVQAPDWWGNEPAIIQHGKKATRKVIVLWAAGAAGPEINSNGAYVAALRQMAYEVLKSPELLKTRWKVSIALTRWRALPSAPQGLSHVIE